MQKSGLNPNLLGIEKQKLPGIDLETIKSVNISQFSTVLFQQRFCSYP